MNDSSLRAVRRGVFLYSRYSLVLDAIASVLSGTGLEVVGRATVPERALDLLAETSPRLLIAGTETPPGSIDALSFLRQAAGPPLLLPVIAIAERPGAYPVDELLATGIAAFIDTRATLEDVDVAIRQAHDQSIYLRRRPQAAPSGVSADDILSPRERETLQLTSQGYSNDEVAAELRITRQTVKFHLSNVYRKLNVANRTEASRWAALAAAPAGDPSASGRISSVAATGPRG
jgi:DNA-binding NarL/FixJ family response regulator